MDRSIVDAMKAVPSTERRQLSYRQLKDFGLGYINTTYAEVTRYKVSRKYGEDGVSKYAQLLSNFEACAETLVSSCSGKALAQYDQRLRDLEKDVSDR